MKRRILFIFAISLVFLLSIPLSLISKEKILFESFEKIGLWGMGARENNAKQISPSILHATHSRHSLKIMFQNPTSTNKAIAVCEKPYDFSWVENLYIDIFNESKSKSKNYFSLALYTGLKWELHETKPHKLSTGWNKNIKIKVHKKIWRTDKKAKKHTRALANPSDIRRIALVFYGPGGTAYIDNIRITGSIDKEPDQPLGEELEF